MSIPASACPILMYHKVGHPIREHSDRYLNISAKSFYLQMQVMARMGYQARPFGEIIEAFAAEKTLPQRTFGITFDDGYQCVRTAAAPILAKLNFPATVFVVSDCVSGVNSWDVGCANPILPLMNWVELGELISAGWEIGGHTRSHKDLAILDDSAAYEEINFGKREVEERLKYPLRTFCYPFGHFNARTPDLVRSAGFLGACTTVSGLTHSGISPYRQPRVKLHREGVADMLFRLLVRPRFQTYR